MAAATAGGYLPQAHAYWRAVMDFEVLRRRFERRGRGLLYAFRHYDFETAEILRLRVASADQELKERCDQMALAAPVEFYAEYVAMRKLLSAPTPVPGPLFRYTFPAYLETRSRLARWFEDRVAAYLRPAY